MGSHNHPPPTVTNVSPYQFAPSPPVYPHPPPLSPQCTFPSSSNENTTSAETKPPPPSSSSSSSNLNNPPLIRQHHDLPPPNLRVNSDAAAAASSIQKFPPDTHRAAPLPVSTPISTPSTPSRENSSSRLALTSASSNATPCDTPFNS